MSHLCVPLAMSYTLQASITSALVANTRLVHSDPASTLKHACQLLPMVRGNCDEARHYLRNGLVHFQRGARRDDRHSVVAFCRTKPSPLRRLEKNLSSWLSNRNSQLVLRQSTLHPCHVIHLPAFAHATEEASTGLVSWRTPASSVLSREAAPLQLKVVMKQCEALVAVRLTQALSLHLDILEQLPLPDLYHPATRCLAIVPASSTACMHRRLPAPPVLASPPVNAAALHAGLPRQALAAREPNLDASTAAGVEVPNSFSRLGTAVPPASFHADRYMILARHSCLHVLSGELAHRSRMHVRVVECVWKHLLTSMVLPDFWRSNSAGSLVLDGTFCGTASSPPHESPRVQVTGHWKLVHHSALPHQFRWS
jgi:hypothetical protein